VRDLRDCIRDPFAKAFLPLMFKKPLSQLKTSAPLRASDRRKLKQRVVSMFSVDPDEGDTLVPDGILMAKFSSYAKEPGVSLF